MNLFDLVKTHRLPTSPMDACEAKGWHRHQCSQCGNLWKHPNPENGHYTSDAEYDLAHHCAVCGTEQRWKFVPLDYPNREQVLAEQRRLGMK